LFSNFLYVAVCFAYIVPVAQFGLFHRSIRPEHFQLPKHPFVVMGALDCLATSMQLFASVYLPGPLLILLPQASIPFSMMLSKFVLGERYRWSQYVGAVVVLFGVLVVLEPIITSRHSPDFYCEALNFDNGSDCLVCKREVTEEACLAHNNTANQHKLHPMDWFLAVTSGNGTSDGNDSGNATAFDGDDDPSCQWLPFEDANRHDEFLVFVWSLMMIASTIPMTLSTIYKQVALGDGVGLDPIFLNGVIAIFQLLVSAVIIVPAAWLASPSILPADLPGNLWDGLRCYLGTSTIEDGCHPDTYCPSHASLFVNLCLLSNVFYTLFMMLVVKYGSTALLFLAMTVIVPIGNLSFALPFVPAEAAITTVYLSDVFGLVIIIVGLALYRFADEIYRSQRRRRQRRHERLRRQSAQEPEVEGLLLDENDDEDDDEIEDDDTSVRLHPWLSRAKNSHLWSDLQETLREPLLSGDV